MIIYNSKLKKEKCIISCQSNSVVRKLQSKLNPSKFKEYAQGNALSKQHKLGV